MNYWLKKLIFLLIVVLILVVPVITRGADVCFIWNSCYVKTPTEGWNPTNLSQIEEALDINRVKGGARENPIVIQGIQDNLKYIGEEKAKIQPWIDAENILKLVWDNPTSPSVSANDLVNALNKLDQLQKNPTTVFTELQNNFLTLNNLYLRQQIALKQGNPAIAQQLQKPIDAIKGQQDTARSIADSSIPSVCKDIIRDFGCNVVYGITIVFHNLFMPLAGQVLKWANDFFNLVFQYTVRDFGNYISPTTTGADGTTVSTIGAVQRGWTVSRDLVNMALIFVLIYAALGLILKADNNQKKVVAYVIIVALLVNFSAMLTGIVIDASNIVANQFYKMAGAASGQNVAASGASGSKAPDITTGMIKNSTTGTTIAALYQAQKEGKITNTGLLTRILIQDIGKIPFFIITAVVLVAASLMFFVRALTLIFLIILSPLAFLAWALPSANKHFAKWSKSLVDNCLFAPAFFFLFMITIMIVKSGPFSTFGGQSGDTDVGYIQNFIYLILMNGMMIGSLLVAKEFGAYGASGAMGVLKKGRGLAMRGVGGSTLGLAGRFGRGTIGRWASSKADSAELEKRAAAGGMRGFVARNQLKALRGVAGSSFDVRAAGAAKAVGLDKSLGQAIGKGGYTKAKEESVKKEEKFAESLGINNKDEYLENLAKRGGFGFGVGGIPTGVAAGAAAFGPLGALVGGIIGYKTGRVMNRDYNQQVIDKINHTKESEQINKYNEEKVQPKIDKYKIDENYNLKKKAAYDAEEAVKTARAAVTEASGTFGPATDALAAELRAAQDRSRDAKEEFEKVKTGIKNLEKEKKTWKKKGPSFEEALKEALKKEREETGGSGGDKSTPAPTP